MTGEPSKKTGLTTWSLYPWLGSPHESDLGPLHAVTVVFLSLFVGILAALYFERHSFSYATDKLNRLI